MGHTLHSVLGMHQEIYKSLHSEPKSMLPTSECIINVGYQCINFIKHNTMDIDILKMTTTMVRNSARF